MVPTELRVVGNEALPRKAALDHRMAAAADRQAGPGMHARSLEVVAHGRFGESRKDVQQRGGTRDGAQALGLSGGLLA